MKTFLRFELLIIFLLSSLAPLFGQWQSIGPFGISYNTILKFDPFTAGRLYANGGGQFFRSDNNGTLWQSVDPPIDGMNGGHELVISTTVVGEVYAVGEMTIYKSSNSGDTWTPYYTTSNRDIVFLNGLNPKHMLAYVDHGSGYGGTFVRKITQSTDGGITWRITMEGIDSLLGGTRVCINKNFPHIMFSIQDISYGGDVIYGHNVFRTSDTGKSWEKLNLKTDEYYGNVIFDPTDSNIVYLMYGRSKWFKSTNKGDTWSGIGSGLPNGSTNNLLISPTNSNELFTSIVSDSLEQCDIYNSVDGGNSWHIWGSVIPSQDISGLAIDIFNPSNLYAASLPYGVVRTSDKGQSWINLSQGLTQTNISSCTPVNEKVIYAGVGSIGLEKTTDGGVSWQIIVKDRSSETGRVIVSRSNPEVLYTNIFMNGGGVSKSTDGGISWKTSKCPTCLFSTFDIGSDNKTIYGNTIKSGNNGLTIGGVAKSSDDGQTWTSVDLGISGINYIDKIVVDPLNNSTVYVRAWLRGNINTDVLLKSTDGGNQWKEVADSVANFFLHQQNSKYLYYTSESAAYPGIFISSDEGETFQRVSSGLSIKSLSADPKKEGTVYALTTGGNLIFSGDYGFTWEIFSVTGQSIILSGVQTALAEDGKVVLFGQTTKGGINMYKINGQSAVEELISTDAMKYTLMQNYPNPFNPSTSIQYTVVSRQNVKVTIYNSLGQVVKTFNEGEKASGSYSINFNGEGLSSGVYLYSINAVSVDGKENFRATKKMIVLK